MNDYYVYGHCLQEDSVLFYVGKGRGCRSTDVNNRSKAWHRHVHGRQWYTTILFDNLSEQQALDKEHELLNACPNLVNVIRTNKHHKETDFSKFFYYDESSSSCLRWRVWNGQTNVSRRDTGDVAGHIIKSSDGITLAYRVGVLRKEFKVHRIVAMLNGLDCIGMVVDHLDGNPLNNKISNLRVVSQNQNTRNAAMRSDNKTGFSGVTISMLRNGPVYIARVKLNGTCWSKSYSVRKYGLLPSFTRACEWRNQKIKELNEQGAGYTERHGT